MANMALLKCEMKENEFIGLILNVHGPLYIHNTWIDRQIKL